MPDHEEPDSFIPGGIVHPKKRAFLVALVSSGGNISEAARAINIARNTVYDWETADEDFAEVFRSDAIKKRASDALVDEARRRAMDGSDSLLMFLLKGDRPEYNHHRVDITSGDKPIRFSLSLGEDGDSGAD
jgi:hypothetical protein